MGEPSEWMTTREAADRLRLTVKTLSWWAREGRIPAARVGGQWRFPRADIEAMLRLPSDEPARVAS